MKFTGVSEPFKWLFPLKKLETFRRLSPFLPQGRINMCAIWAHARIIGPCALRTYFWRQRDVRTSEKLVCAQWKLFGHMDLSKRCALIWKSRVRAWPYGFEQEICTHLTISFAGNGSFCGHIDMSQRFAHIWKSCVRAVEIIFSICIWAKRCAHI